LHGFRPIAVVDDLHRRVVRRFFRQKAGGGEDVPERVVVLAADAEVQHRAARGRDVVRMIQRIQHQHHLIVAEHDVTRGRQRVHPAGGHIRRTQGIRLGKPAFAGVFQLGAGGGHGARRIPIEAGRHVARREEQKQDHGGA
jgi:hypothetical protein